jgi:hypothetical protein
VLVLGLQSLPNMAPLRASAALAIALLVVPGCGGAPADGEAEGALGWKTAGASCHFGLECAGSLTCVLGVCATEHYTVTGTVADATLGTASPFSGQRVELLESTGKQLPYDAAALAATTTAADGSFSLVPPKAGSYVVFISDPNDAGRQGRFDGTAWQVEFTSGPVVVGGSHHDFGLTPPSWWSNHLPRVTGSDSGVVIDLGQIYANVHPISDLPPQAESQSLFGPTNAVLSKLVLPAALPGQRVSGIDGYPVRYDGQGLVASFDGYSVSYDGYGRAATLMGYSVVYDAEGRVTVLGGYPVTYDPNGIVTVIHGYPVHYDDQGRVVAFGGYEVYYNDDGTVFEMHGYRVSYEPRPATP